MFQIKLPFSTKITDSDSFYAVWTKSEMKKTNELEMKVR